MVKNVMFGAITELGVSFPFYFLQFFLAWNQRQHATKSVHTVWMEGTSEESFCISGGTGSTYGKDMIGESPLIFCCSLLSWLLGNSQWHRSTSYLEDT